MFSTGVTVDTTTSATSGTLLSSTVFADFGVNVSVRPLVGEDDVIAVPTTGRGALDPEALRQHIERDRAAGHRQVLLTGALDFVARPVADFLGIKEVVALIEGKGAYTAVDGERTTMLPGDFVITPCG